MTEYSDLSPYTYWEDSGCGSTPNPTPTMLNIGWLGRNQQFNTGPCPPEVLEVLHRLAAEPKNVMRGLHYCEFCDVESPIKIPSSGNKKGFAWLGTGEIHIATTGNVTYVAPTLAIHYMEAHSYSPPIQFIEAVLRLA
ncbi:hypothetical protein Ssi03_45210 [Sphaerisporangium siamense]|uniref:DUF7919 domain-containing protein n=1 Tax=Sphaerisporangium siamense TaxID=795645 RepID=A0A7W7DEJ2_9ACTN|nr:hypothetical protein [Sphaerisporangium siamense]MBB4705317.1 hypothetical protein [Sphaerisporangium siamense]GII86531.1 hypothetical protein Ssi03_45210 [Sphaerisporangium siamense]